MTDDVIIASLLECKSNVTFHLVSYIYNALLSFDVNSYFRYPSRNSIRYLPDNLPDKASPGETGSASRVTQTEIVYKVTHLYNVFPIAA